VAANFYLVPKARINGAVPPHSDIRLLRAYVQLYLYLLCVIMVVNVCVCCGRSCRGLFQSLSYCNNYEK
jgi:hypothetical protein